MKPTIKKLAAIPIAVVHRATPCVWELKHNPLRLPRVGGAPSVPPCFIARGVDVPLVTWKGGIELPGPPPAPVFFDALTLRDEFMQLKTDKQFLDFLNRVGVFSPLPHVERSHGWLPQELASCQPLHRGVKRARGYSKAVCWRSQSVPRAAIFACPVCIPTVLWRRQAFSVT